MACQPPRPWRSEPRELQFAVGRLVFLREAPELQIQRGSGPTHAHKPVGPPRPPSGCLEIREGGGRKRRRDPGAALAAAWHQGGGPSGVQTRWLPAIMDPAEAVLQEKALKFMVRRCRPGNGGDGGVCSVVVSQAWAACPPEEGATGLWAEAGGGVC